MPCLRREVRLGRARGYVGLPSCASLGVARSRDRRRCALRSSRASRDRRLLRVGRLGKRRACSTSNAAGETRAVDQQQARRAGRAVNSTRRTVHGRFANPRGNPQSVRNPRSIRNHVASRLGLGVAAPHPRSGRGLRATVRRGRNRDRARAPRTRGGRRRPRGRQPSARGWGARPRASPLPIHDRALRCDRARGLHRPVDGDDRRRRRRRPDASNRRPAPERDAYRDQGDSR